MDIIKTIKEMAVMEKTHIKDCLCRIKTLKLELGDEEESIDRHTRNINELQQALNKLQEK